MTNHLLIFTQNHLLEEELLRQFRQQRNLGKSVKKWWFLSRVKKIMLPKYPTVTNFKLNRRFNGFCRRNKLSLRRKIHVFQKVPSQIKPAVQKFYAELFPERKRRTFALCEIANMDQTALPFVLDDGRAYDAKSSEEIWFSSGKSGLDKRHNTIQLTVFTDGTPRVRPRIIFWGEGKRIKASEKGSWDKRVKVYFQKKACCDEQLLKEWTCDEWGNNFTNPPTNGSREKILVVDAHRTHQTDPIKRLLQIKKTILVNMPPRFTIRVQPFDVLINKLFENAIKEQFKRHLDDGKLTVSDRRFLTHCTKKMMFSTKDFFSKCADLLTFTEYILSGKLHLLCSDNKVGW